jgi:hypothetical protein
MDMVGVMLGIDNKQAVPRVIEALVNVMVMKGIPEHLRSHNGPSSSPRVSPPAASEFVASGNLVCPSFQVRK